MAKEKKLVSLSEETMEIINFYSKVYDQESVSKIIEIHFKCSMDSFLAKNPKKVIESISRKGSNEDERCYPYMRA